MDIEDNEVEDVVIVGEVEADEAETDAEVDEAEVNEEAPEDETTGEADDESDGGDDDGVEEESDAVNVVIGVAEDESETPVIRTLRTKMRDAERKAKELQKKLDEKEAVNKLTELGPEPDLADEGIDYDGKKFAAAVLEWNEKKRSVDADKERQQKATEAFQNEWREKHSAYKQRSKDIGIPDFEETVEAQFRDSFSANQQSILVDVCMKPEVVMLALSQNEALADKLAGESNPVRYAAELVRLESKMKVSGMKPTTKPEKRLVGTKVPKSANSQLDKLRAEAEKSGDYTAVVAYRRQMQSK